MPSAGAIVPPTISALRKPIPGKPSTHVDTATYIELNTDSEGCRIYFSTDGSKPNPHKLKYAGKETTFRYRGPFTLKGGKRTLKAVAVTRDKLHESNVVTKTFTVVDVGPPNEDDDLESLATWDAHGEEDYDEVYEPQQVVPYKVITPQKFKRPKSGKPKKTKEAWGNANNGFHPEVHADTVQPDGPFTATNHSGTQYNFWGAAHGANGMYPGGYSLPPDRPTQLGFLTDKMIKNIEQPKLTVKDVRELIDYSRPVETPAPPPPAIEYPVKSDPVANEISPGEGDWKGQLEHIYAHLIERCKNNTKLRAAIAEPKMGKIVLADFDEDEDAYTLNITLIKPGHKLRPKPKPTPAPVEPVRPKPVPKAPVKKFEPPPKPKPEPKKPEPKKTEPKKVVKREPKPPPKLDPYFETEEYEQEGTLKPWPHFDAEIDCEVLRKAMKGLGTDERKIIDILGYRCSSQRVEVDIMFKTMFGKPLRDELEGELSGNFEEVCVAMLKPPPEYDASEIHKAVKGLGTDDDALIEILCTRTNKQILAMKEAYQKLYQKDMDKDVEDDTSGYFKELLKAQMVGKRDENPTFDRTAAKQDAENLYKAGEKKWGTDESTFNQILCRRSFPHLRAVFEEYGKLSKKDIEDVIKSEFSGDIKNGLLTVVRCIKDKPGYFAKKLQKCMKGLGTDDSSMIRVVVSRCECDMVQIMNSFQSQFGKGLAEWIKDDCSGDYKEMMLALIGDRPAPIPSAEEIEATEGEPELEEVEEENLPEDPTLLPADPFDAKKDCEVLKKAMKGFGTDEDAIISVYGHRSNQQRMEIIKMYRTMYGKDLIKELKSEISGNFEDTIVALCQQSDEYDANELRKAMKGLGTDEDTLVEILCTRESEEISKLKEAYTRLHKRNLEEDIISETSGHLKRLLVSMVQANRPSGNIVDRRKARNDAKNLYEAGEKKFGTDESRFNVILCSRSFAQLRATFEEYQKLANKDIEDSIKEEMSGDLKKGMVTIVRCVRNKSQQYAMRLHDAMKGLGTDDSTLVRVCVSRCEVDMVQIKEHFQTMYNDSLGKFIKGDISGDYRKIILAIIGEEQLLSKK